MAFKITRPYRGSVQALNVIPVIDILFQLIIFFSLVSTFVDINNFSVSVPDSCGFANLDPNAAQLRTTVTVMRTADEKIDFAVGSQKITAKNYTDIVRKLSALIDANLKNLPPQRRVVTLRVDKDVPFTHAQYALAGIASSSATDIQMATLKDRRSDSK